MRNVLRNVSIIVDGKEISGGLVDVLLPSNEADLERSVFGPGNLEISGHFELSVPRDLEKLRSVSPAAKRAFARDRVARFIRKLGGKTMIKTDDVLPHKVFLGDVMDVFDGDEIPEVVYTGVVGTCAGEWRKEAGQVWRFWKDEGGE